MEGTTGRSCCHYSEIKRHKGLASTASISKALKELEDGGWIIRESCGGLMRTANLYGFPDKHDSYFPNLGCYAHGKQASGDQAPSTAKGLDDADLTVVAEAPDPGPCQTPQTESAARYKESSRNEVEDRGLSAEPSGRTGAASHLGERAGLQKMTRDPSENEVDLRRPSGYRAVREMPRSA